MSSNNLGTLFGTLFVLMVAVAFGLVLYLFYCFCLKRICQKAGHEPGILIWIPIAQLIPLLTVAKQPLWMILLFFIPLANLVVAVLMWVKICEARGKSGWLAILLFIPLVNLVFIPYLAFAD
jgi:uncharacterized membrane protein YhaH (DUF805 family)